MARTFKQLCPQSYDWGNLWLAWRRARRGGKRKWPTVAEFELDLEQNLWALHEELRDKAYRPGADRYFTIRKPTWLLCYSKSGLQVRSGARGGPPDHGLAGAGVRR